MKKSQPKKGILKKTHESHPEKNAELKWDEQGIAEYDKERGKCMKVSEPKTPYHEMTEEQKKEYEQLGKELNSQSVPYKSNGKIDIEALNSKLKQDQLELEIDQNVMDSEDEEEQKLKNEEFKKKRTEHYKMNFKQLKKQYNNNDKDSSSSSSSDSD